MAENGGARGDGPFGDAVASLAIDENDPVFRRVAAGSHADLLTLERVYDEKGMRMRDEIVVGDVRTVGSLMHLTPGEGGWRVVVVDSADRLNLHAANALLKNLEEPPDNALILLVSDAPGRLLPTIRSRCRKLVMRPLDEALVRAFLARHRPGIGEAAALARLAQGCPGRALELADNDALALYREMVGLAAQAPAFDSQALHGLAELLVGWLARLVRLGAAGAAPAEVFSGEGEVMRGLLARRGLEHWTGVWEKVRRLASDAERAKLNRKQVVLAMFGALENPSRP